MLRKQGRVKRKNFFSLLILGGEAGLYSQRKKKKGEKGKKFMKTYERQKTFHNDFPDKGASNKKCILSGRAQLGGR